MKSMCSKNSDMRSYYKSHLIIQSYLNFGGSYYFSSPQTRVLEYCCSSIKYLSTRIRRLFSPTLLFYNLMFSGVGPVFKVGRLFDKKC